MQFQANMVTHPIADYTRTWIEDNAPSSRVFGDASSRHGHKFDSDLPIHFPRPHSTCTKVVTVVQSEDKPVSTSARHKPSETISSLAPLQSLKPPAHRTGQLPEVHTAARTTRRQHSCLLRYCIG